MILQGLTFIFNYYNLILKSSELYPPPDSARMKQEAEYNVGRVFHQLGLLTLAVGYYERAIEVGGVAGGGVRFEAAHNLALVYALSGNMGASRDVTERYLVL
jgi:general transcription factor 3C polypeptide 3 (transcription factor C subunit 4)